MEEKGSGDSEGEGKLWRQLELIFTPKLIVYPENAVNLFAFGAEFFANGCIWLTYEISTVSACLYCFLIVDVLNILACLMKKLKSTNISFLYISISMYLFKCNSFPLTYLKSPNNIWYISYNRLTKTTKRLVDSMVSQQIISKVNKLLGGIKVRYKHFVHLASRLVQLLHSSFLEFPCI